MANVVEIDIKNLGLKTFIIRQFCDNPQAKSRNV